MQLCIFLVFLVSFDCAGDELGQWWWCVLNNRFHWILSVLERLGAIAISGICLVYPTTGIFLLMPTAVMISRANSSGESL
jgi:hypothetical protein